MILNDISGHGNFERKRAEVGRHVFGMALHAGGSSKAHVWKTKNRIVLDGGRVCLVGNTKITDGGQVVEHLTLPAISLLSQTVF